MLFESCFIILICPFKSLLIFNLLSISCINISGDFQVVAYLLSNEILAPILKLFILEIFLTFSFEISIVNSLLIGSSPIGSLCPSLSIINISSNLISVDSNINVAFLFILIFEPDTLILVEFDFKISPSCFNAKSVFSNVASISLFVVSVVHLL